MILAIDPGREKCGLAVMDQSAQLLEKKIAGRFELSGEVPRLMQKYRIETIVIGSGTASKGVHKDLLKMELNAHLVFIPEKNSTLQARKRYWKEHEPQGLLRFIPRALLNPPHPVDDYAALILGERYLKG
jgi:RNase H-fold protein (predicted Holliday junction resolvase)